MTITSTLRFLYILGGSGLLCVVPGSHRGAMASSDFGRSVNPISTRGQIMPTNNYYSLPKIFRPSDIPAVLFDATAKTGENRQISTTNHQFYT